MAGFRCDYCEYETCKKYNLSKHEKSKKHLIAVKKHESEKSGDLEKLHVCENCGKKYKHIESLIGHRQTCSENLLKTLRSKISEITNTVEAEKERIAVEKEKLEYENMQLKKTNESLERNMGYARKDIEYFKGLVTRSGQIINKSLNTINHLTLMHHDSPPLKKFNESMMISTDANFAETLIQEYDSGKLAIYLVQNKSQ